MEFLLIWVISGSFSKNDLQKCLKWAQVNFIARLCDQWDLDLAQWHALTSWFGVLRSCRFDIEMVFSLHYHGVFITPSKVPLVHKLSLNFSVTIWAPKTLLVSFDIALKILRFWCFGGPAFFHGVAAFITTLRKWSKILQSGVPGVLQHFEVQNAHDFFSEYFWGVKVPKTFELAKDGPGVCIGLSGDKVFPAIWWLEGTISTGTPSTLPVLGASYVGPMIDWG